MTLPEGHGSTGRSVFNKLRELKTLHEHSWDPAIMKRDAPVKLDDEVEEKFARMERERAGNVAKSRSKFKAKLWMKHKRKVLNNQKPNAIADMALICAKLKEGKNHIGLVGAGTNTPVEIHWTNIDDAHYAAHWSDNVIHDTLRVEANNRDSTKPRPFHATMAAYVAEKQRLAGKATVSA